MSQPPDDNKWHLDRRVPLALIVTIVLAILGQTAAGIWFISDLNRRVGNLEGDAVQSRTDSRNLIKLEGLVDELRRIVNRLESAPRP